MTAATQLRERQDGVRRAAENLIEHIQACGPSFETRLAVMRVDEAVMWTHRHITHQFDRRQLERKMEMDLFDRIAAAIAAKNSGDNAGYDDHLTALDSEVAQQKGWRSHYPQPRLVPGDRIRLTHMGTDPNPVPVGTEGTVTSVPKEYGTFAVNRDTVGVHWDNNRSLRLIIGTDAWEKIDAA